MKIVHDVLKACGYSVKAVFTFTYQWNEVKFNRQVFPFVSEQYPDDVYLLVSIRPGELAHTLDNGFMSALTTSFRKQEFHSSAMDRNTTLLLSCLCNAGEQINYDLRVQLEDDPYYFKKYVFTYGTTWRQLLLERKDLQFLKAMVQSLSLVGGMKILSWGEGKQPAPYY